jgi:hypothetical protein
MRAEAERHNAWIDAAVQREQDRQIRLDAAVQREQDRQIRQRWNEDRARAAQHEQTKREILRRAEFIELELDNIPRPKRQHTVNPFGFSRERAAEYAAVLRGMVRV